MLGRTDSRVRLLLLLTVFVVGSLALVARLAFWQIGERDMLLARAAAQTTVRLETPSLRGSIYDRSGTVALATTVERDRLAAAPSQMTDAVRDRTGTELIRLLDLDEEAARMIQFQQSYQAAAKMLQVAQSVFDTLLQTAGVLVLVSLVVVAYTLTRRRALRGD